MLGQQRGRQLLAVGVHAAGDHALRHHRRQPDALEVAQQPVLAERHGLDRLLDGVRPVAEAHDPHDVPREAAGQRDDVLASSPPAAVDQGSVTIAGSGRLATMRRACEVAMSFRLVRRWTRVDARARPETRFRTGQVVTRREVLHGRPWLESPVTVVADAGDVLAVLLEPGSVVHLP